ncbi:MAG: response regulator [Pseudomonadales bacterium]|nr:response regulator [Pseudomonadales bacterium]
MPSMTGEERNKELLKIRPGFPIIMTTDYSKAFSEEEALSLGIRQYLRKHIQLKSLADTIASCLA